MPATQLSGRGTTEKCSRDNGHGVWFNDGEVTSVRQFLPRKLQRKESTNHPLVKCCGQGPGKWPACSVPQGCSCSPGVSSEPGGGVCFCPGPSQGSTLRYHTAKAEHKETTRKTARETAQAAVAFYLAFGFSPKLKFLSSKTAAIQSSFVNCSEKKTKQNKKMTVDCELQKGRRE